MKRISILLFAAAIFAPSLGSACGLEQSIHNWLLMHPDYTGSAQSINAIAGPEQGPIVGGWELTLSAGGSIVDYIFIQFHNGGTEIETDITDVLSGNVCLGVWEKLSDGTYGVTHPSFNFYGYDTHPGKVLFENPATPPGTGLAGQPDGTLGVLFFRLAVSKDGQKLTGKMNFEDCSPLDFLKATCTAPVTLDVSGQRITVQTSRLPK